MSLFNRVLPMPFISLAIVALWVVLAPGWNLGSLLFGTLLGVFLPWLTQDFWPNHPQIMRPLAAVAFFLRIVGDIIVANINVAWLVLGRLERMEPGFIEVPTDIEDPFVATLLGAILSLAPGTVTIEINRARRVLLVHVLDLKDAEAMIDSIKTRYEAPLKEIFQC